MTIANPESPTPRKTSVNKQKIIANLRHENASLVQCTEQEQRINVLETSKTTRTRRYQILSLRILVCHLYMLKNNALLQQQNDIIARDREFRNQEA